MKPYSVGADSPSRAAGGRLKHQSTDGILYGRSRHATGTAAAQSAAMAQNAAAPNLP
jgi:hypothetical protein